MAHSPTTRSNIHQRFWSKVDMAGDCWEWTAVRAKGGYGAFYLPAGEWSPFGRKHSAQRVAYYLTTGEWPGDLRVCHSCDNPPCVRPSHLWLGTATENMRDMHLKGRAFHPGIGDGETNPRHKLKDAQVVEIVRRLALGEHPRVLAVEFKVSRALIYAYRKGTKRRDITAAI